MKVTMDVRANLKILVLLATLGQLYAVDTIVNCPITGTHKCVCHPGVIDCEGHGMTSYPVLSNAGSYGILKLGNNSFFSIPADAFSSTNMSEIDLTANSISLVETGAFNGLTSVLQRLKLANNSLTDLPLAITSIQNLIELDVSWNPIPGHRAGHGHSHGSDGLTDTIMRSIGKNLRKFSFGSRHMTSWPETLDHLNRLEELTVTGINLPYWPAQCFHGFEHTLTSLTIDGAILEAVPLGISFLDHLKILHLNNLNVSPNFGDDSMISAPFSTLSSTLEELSLRYDGLTTFPEGIQDLRKLTRLILDGNNLEFVSDEAIKLLINSNVSYLSLQDCNLKRIPGAISNLRNLKELDLSNNKIRSIESTDLRHLSSLNTLSLNLNPLIYISDNFSCGLDALRTFNLIDTSLREITKSFKNLVTLRKLDLSNSKIDCTCDLTWINYWINCRGASVQLIGDCETIDQDIQSYVEVRLLRCPGFPTDRRDFTCGSNC
ncbi:hypothetical protein ACF0H5_020719 [Mactra antiquata]